MLSHLTDDKYDLKQLRTERDRGVVGHVEVVGVGVVAHLPREQCQFEGSCVRRDLRCVRHGRWLPAVRLFPPALTHVDS